MWAFSVLGCYDKLNQSSNQNDFPPMQISTAHPVNRIVSNNTLYQSPIIQQNQQQPQVQRNSFFLKWIAGTTISKCYGCQEKNTKSFKTRTRWLGYDIIIFASLEILLLGYCDILMHLKMSISIYDHFVSEPDIPTSVTLGLMYHFKCSSLFRHCTFRDYYPSFIGAHEIHISYFWNFFQDYGFCLLSFHDHFYFSVKLFGLWDVFGNGSIIGTYYSSYYSSMVWCLLNNYSRQLSNCQISLSNGFS